MKRWTYNSVCIVHLQRLDALFRAKTGGPRTSQGRAEKHGRRGGRRRPEEAFVRPSGSRIPEGQQSGIHDTCGVVDMYYQMNILFSVRRRPLAKTDVLPMKSGYFHQNFGRLFRIPTNIVILALKSSQSLPLGQFNIVQYCFANMIQQSWKRQ